MIPTYGSHQISDITLQHVTCGNKSPATLCERRGREHQLQSLETGPLRWSGSPANNFPRLHQGWPWIATLHMELTHSAQGGSRGHVTIHPEVVSKFHRALNGTPPSNHVPNTIHGANDPTWANASNNVIGWC